MSKKILITGGAGFIGSHAVIEAINQGYKVWNLDALTYAANLKNLTSVINHPNYHFIHGDINNQKLLTGLFLMEKFDFVMHLAAESHVDLSISNPDVFIKTNVNGTHNLLALSHEFKVKKFIHVSTDEVYGDLQENEAPFTEDHPLKPNSPYSASKASSDLIVRSYVKTYNFPACITRCSNNYGPHQDHSKLIPLIIKKAILNEKIPIYGQGQNIRDWLFVSDHVQALFKVLEQGKIGEVYNIGGDNEHRNIDIAQKILYMLGKPLKLIKLVKDRPGHDWRYAINADKIQQNLHWQVQTDFDNGLKQTIDSIIKRIRLIYE